MQGVCGNDTGSAQGPGENGLRQRAQRRGLSLRKERSEARTRPTMYWLVAPGIDTPVAGGDVGLPLDGIAAWLSSSSTQRESAAAGASL
jgi:hypothetical protein